MAQNGPRFGLILTLAKVPIVVKAVIRPSDQIVINMSPLSYFATFPSIT